MSKQFFGGLPTAMDVRQLVETFGQSPIEGREITHEEVERVIGVARSASRYKSVTGAWRRHMLAEHNVDVGAVAGVGFRILRPDERVTASVKSFQGGTRKQMRSIKRVMLVRSDDEVIRRKQDVMRRIGAAVVDQASTMMKEIEPPKPRESMPKIAHIHAKTGT